LSDSVPPLVKTISAAGADQGSDLLARGFDRTAGALAWRMDGSCVGKFG